MVKSPMAYIVRGVAYQKAGEYSLAIADFAKAISLDPDEDKFHNYLENVKAEKDKQGKLIGDFRFVAKNIKDSPVKGLRVETDKIKRELGSGVVALVSVNEGRASLVVSVTKDLTPRISAVELVRLGSQALGGTGGGGRDDFAQGGGPNKDGVKPALEAIESALEKAAEATTNTT